MQERNRGGHVGEVVGYGQEPEPELELVKVSLVLWGRGASPEPISLAHVKKLSPGSHGAPLGRGPSSCATPHPGVRAPKGVVMEGTRGQAEG